MKDPKLDWLSDKTKRSYRQTEYLAELTDSFEELCFLEEQIKNNHCSYCPDDKEEVIKILKAEPKTKWFKLPTYNNMENQFLTISELIQHLLNIQENQGKDIPVFISEKVIDGKGAEKTIIRQLQKSDLQIENDLSNTAAFIISQENKGLVIGFVPTVD